MSLDRHRLSPVPLVGLALVLGLLASIRPATALSITFVDPVSPPGVPTGHPQKPWTGPEKAVLTEALGEWRAVIRMFDKHGGTWTLRWEDRDLFRNWGSARCDFSRLAGVTAVPSVFRDCRIPADFPPNEIYFNLTTPWFVDPTPAFDGNDAGEVPAGQIDLLTVAKHELGHGLGVLTGGTGGAGHLRDGAGGAMEEIISSRERHRITAADLALVRAQGGDLAAWVVPEPTTVLLFSTTAAGLALAGWRQRRKARRQQKGSHPAL